MITVTAHAIERYQERVANLAVDEVIARLTTPHIIKAALFGDCKVRLPSGHRAVIVDRVVVTITPFNRSPVRKPMREANANR